MAQIYACVCSDYVPQVEQDLRGLLLGLSRADRADLRRADARYHGRKNTLPKLIYVYPEICSIRLRWGFHEPVSGIRPCRIFCVNLRDLPEITCAICGKYISYFAHSWHTQNASIPYASYGLPPIC